MFSFTFTNLKRAALLLFVTGLLGCQTTETSTNFSQQPEQNQGFAKVKSLVRPDTFGAKPTIPEPEALFQLEDRFVEHFKSYMSSPGNQQVPEHKRLSNYLDLYISDYDYLGKTFTANEALAAESGNCVSLAIVTAAFAKLTTLEISYQEVQTAPVFDRENGFETASSHVVTRIYDPGFVPDPNTIYMTRPHIIIDYFPTRDSWRGKKIKEEEFTSFYYRNIASDLLVAGQLDKAGWWAYTAFTLAPTSIKSINLLAVIYRRKGEENLAEEIYRNALIEAPDNLELYTNLRYLLNSQGRHKEVAEIESKMETLEEPSPFYWYDIGLRYLAQERYSRALVAFDKVIQKAPYLHFGYAGKGRALYQLGQKRAAKENLELALERTHKDKTEALYQAKLAALEIKESTAVSTMDEVVPY